MKLVIVEDQPIIRESLRRICTGEFGHEVVGEAACAEDAVAVTLACKPEVVLLDVGLPDGSGLTVAARVQPALPTVRFLIMSGFVDDYTVYRAEKLGVHGFIDKNTSPSEALQSALTALAAGRTWFSPSVQAIRHTRHADPKSFAKVLSDTEQQVLALIGSGLDDDEIGRKFGITRATAQTHRSHILCKLAIKSTPKLVAFSIAHGFVRAGSP
jgi:DNA-binding NarL/FixJ family response regulator